MNRREFLSTSAAALAAAAALPVELEEPESHLGDFFGDCEGLTLFGLPRPRCEWDLDEAAGDA